jgi:phosphoglucosamine mutase
MSKLFGTDGIRGAANEYPLIPDMAVTIGKAMAQHFKGPTLVVGRDTRLSCDMLESALISGICSTGVSPYLSGVLPTPGIAFLTRTLPAAAGIMISASHNPYFDNGIKVFGGDGFKLSDKEEADIEHRILTRETDSIDVSQAEIGKVHRLDDAGQRYAEFLKTAMPPGFNLKGLHIVADCANGATHMVAPELLTDLGASVETLFIHPDGKNINNQCGSQHTEVLAKKVLETGADIGLAFDGDGDRLIAVDETGATLTGDQILALCARTLKKQAKLKNDCVVSTVMSNLGLGLALKEMGIRHILADVGDRYVMQQMLKSGSVLGGEDSGHMIFLDHHTTGDGLLTALKLMECMQVASRPLSEIKKIMTVFPQILINVKVKQKPDMKDIPEIQDAIDSVKNALGQKGRVLVRYSGTQPECRIMVEGPSEQETRDYCQQIAEVVKEKIGVS